MQDQSRMFFLWRAASLDENPCIFPGSTRKLKVPQQRIVDKVMVQTCRQILILTPWRISLHTSNGIRWLDGWCNSPLWRLWSRLAQPGLNIFLPLKQSFFFSVFSEMCCMWSSFDGPLMRGACEYYVQTCLAHLTWNSLKWRGMTREQHQCVKSSSTFKAPGTCYLHLTLSACLWQIDVWFFTAWPSFRLFCIYCNGWNPLQMCEYRHFVSFCYVHSDSAESP